MLSCSIGSFRLFCADGDNLSNSSIISKPESANITPPASMVHPPVNSSLTALVVNPTWLVLVPEILITLGALLLTAVISCDFPIPGSPIRRICDVHLSMMSVLNTSSLGRAPSNSCNSKPSLTVSYP